MKKICAIVGMLSVSFVSSAQSITDNLGAAKNFFDTNPQLNKRISNTADINVWAKCTHFFTTMVYLELNGQKMNADTRYGMAIMAEYMKRMKLDLLDKGMTTAAFDNVLKIAKQEQLTAEDAKFCTQITTTLMKSK